MAAGSRETLTMESADGAELPADLVASSSSPAVFEATNGQEPNTIEMVAHGEGAGRLVVRSGEAIYDSLFFGVEAAGAVGFSSTPLVFEGGAVDVVVTEVFGRCGTDDCPLFGHTFLKWDAQPSGAPDFVLDQGGTATFRAQGPGAFLLRGREPTHEKGLVVHPVEVVSAEGVTGFVATLTTIPFLEGGEERTFELPGSVFVNELFCVRLDALRGSEPAVALSRRDVIWTVLGDDAVSLVPTEHTSEPIGTLFIAGAAPGHVTLVADVALLGESVSFDLDVTP